MFSKKVDEANTDSQNGPSSQAKIVFLKLSCGLGLERVQDVHKILLNVINKKYKGIHYTPSWCTFLESGLLNIWRTGVTNENV